MGIFKRRGRAGQADEAIADATTDEARDEELTDAVSGVARRERPRDRAEVDDSIASDYIEMGSLWVRGIDGMQLQLQIDEEKQVISAVNILLDATIIQLQVFAAPKSGGLWRDIRDDIANSIVSANGAVDIVPGPFGDELHTQVAQPGPDGGTVIAPMRFVGVDGPRWFVRAVVTGAAALGDDEEAMAAAYDVIGDLVIDRGTEAMAPRELLPLEMPAQPEGLALEQEGELDAPAEEEQRSTRTSDLNPFERGPEITEIR